MRDTTAELLTETLKYLKIEPSLIELTGEKLKYKTGNMEDNARLDVQGRNFWRVGDKIFFDIRIFNPLADTYMKKSFKEAYVMN